MRIITVGLIAFIIVILTGQVYMRARRPDMPAGPALVLRRYAPAVAIGASAASHKPRLPDMRYVPHLGFVATNADTARVASPLAFPEVHLLLGEKARARTVTLAQKGDVEAVELVSTRSGIFTELASDLTTLMRGVPREGCIRSETPGNFREARAWISPNDRGGVVLVNDYGGNAEVPYPGTVLVSVIVYRGPFRDGATLRGNFERRPCHQIASAAPQRLTGELALAARASDRAITEYAEAMAEGRAVKALDAEAQRRWRLQGVVDACPSPAIDDSDFRSVDLEPLPVVVRMPPGYEWRRGRTRDLARDSMYATISSGDGQLTLRRSASSVTSHSVTSAPSATHCDEPIAGAQVHIESAISPSNSYRKLVLARYALPTGGSLTVQGYASTPEAQAALLRAVRTISFRYFW